MQATGTHPELTSTICGNLNKWILGDEYHREYHLPDLRKALSDQGMIGWDVMLEGCIVTERD